MNCPDCGSDSIHRSRRRGASERIVLSAFGVFPYRCGACRSRFRRFHPALGRDVGYYVDTAPDWLKRLVWTVVAVVIGLAMCLLVLLRIAR